MNRDEIIREAAELPIEDRALVIDSLLKTLHPTDPQIEREWVATGKRRLAEIRSGAVRPTLGSDVLGRILDRFAK
jgi:hypothetical protein